MGNQLYFENPKLSQRKLKNGKNNHPIIPSVS